MKCQSIKDIKVNFYWHLSISPSIQQGTQGLDTSGPALASPNNVGSTNSTMKRWYLQTSLEEIQPGSDLLSSHHRSVGKNSFSSLGDIHSSHLEIGNPYSGHIKLR